MRQRAENKVLAELFLELKGRRAKRRDWITIAKDVKSLIDQHGSYQIAAQKVGVSRELIREIVSVLKLPTQVQSYVSRGEILLDAAQRLNTIQGSEHQVRVARLIAGLPSHDARQVIQYAKRFPNADLDEYKERVASSKARTELIDVIVLPLQHDVFKTLSRIASQRGLSVRRLVQQIVSDFMAKSEGERR